MKLDIQGTITRQALIKALRDIHITTGYDVIKGKLQTLIVLLEESENIKE